MLHDLMEAAPYLALIGIGAGLLLLGRDRSDADEHDLSDYFEQAPDVRTFCAYCCNEQGHQSWCPRHYEPSSLADIPAAVSVELVDSLPPAPPGMNAGSPLYAGMLFDTWHPEDADAVAARWLREMGEQARTALAR